MSPRSPRDLPTASVRESGRLAPRVGLLLALLAPGCLSPATTEFPQIAPSRDPLREKLSYETHDPLPEDVGPKLFIRPRGFETPRSEPRREIEGSVRRGTSPPAGDPFVPPSAANPYPQSVPQ